MLPLPQKPSYLIAEALGARHTVLDFAYSYERSDLMAGSVNGSGWAGKVGSHSTWPLGPKPRQIGPPWSNQNDSPARVVLQPLHHFAQDSYQWGGIWVQILPGQTEYIDCPGQGIWDW